MAKIRWKFQVVKKGQLVEVWEGVPNGPESEHVLSIDESLISAMIAALRQAQGGR